MGPGAILDKELRIQGRRVGTYWVRFGYGVVMAIFVGLTIVNVFTQSLYGGQTATLSTIEQLQRTGPIVLIALAWMQFIGTSLASAIFTSPLVCEERRAGTLGTLLTTPLTAWQIVVGKASGALVQLLILGLMGLPILLGVRVFGGISGELVVYTIAILAGTTIGNCALGILASTLAPRQSGAIASAILFTLLWYAGPPLIGAAIDAAGYTPPWTLLMMLSPGAGMVGLMARLEGEALFGPTPLPFWAMSFLCSLGVAIVAFLIATLRLRALMRQVGVGREGGGGRQAQSSDQAVATSGDQLDPSTPALPMTRRERRMAKRRAIISQRAAARERSRTVGDQPVLWRELRQPLTTRRWVMWLGTMSMVAILAYAFAMARDGDMIAGTVSILGLLASIMMVSGTAGSALGQERESRSWETLLTTPLSAGQILMGKLAGVLVRLRMVWIFVIGSIIIAVVGWGTRPALVIHMAILLVSSSFFVACLGLYFGSITRRSMVAIMATMGTILGIWLVVPIAGAMCAGLAMGGNSKLMSLIAVTNPVAWAIVAMEGAQSGHWSPSYDVFDFGSLHTVGFTIALLVFAGVYAALGMALLTAAGNALAASTLRSMNARTQASLPHVIDPG